MAALPARQAGPHRRDGPREQPGKEAEREIASQRPVQPVPDADLGPVAQSFLKRLEAREREAQARERADVETGTQESKSSTEGGVAGLRARGENSAAENAQRVVVPIPAPRPVLKGPPQQPVYQPGDGGTPPDHCRDCGRAIPSGGQRAHSLTACKAAPAPCPVAPRREAASAQRPGLLRWHCQQCGTVIRAPADLVYPRQEEHRAECPRAELWGDRHEAEHWRTPL